MKKVLKLDLLLIFVFIHYHSVQLNITLFLLFIFTIPMNPPGLPPASLSLIDSYLWTVIDDFFNIEHFFFMFMFIEVATPNLFGVISTSWENPSLFFKSSLISIFTLPKILWELLSLSESLSSFFYPGTKSFDILLFWWITLPSTWAISIKSNFEPRECIFGSGMSKEAPFRQDFLLDMVLKPDFLMEGAGLFGSVSPMISSRGLTWLLLLRNWTSLRFPGILLSEEAITFPSIFFSIDNILL